VRILHCEKIHKECGEFPIALFLWETVGERAMESVPGAVATGVHLFYQVAMLRTLTQPLPEGEEISRY